MLLDNPLSYLPAVVYLALAAVTMPRRAKDAVHATGLLAGLLVHGLTVSWGSAVFSAVAAAAVWVGLVLFGALSRSTTFAIPIALASLPLLSWIALIPGLLLAAGQAVITLWRLRGVTHLQDLSAGTLNALALGAISVTQLKTPNAALPLPTSPTRKSVPLLGMLAIGVAVMAVLAALVR